MATVIISRCGDIPSAAEVLRATGVISTTRAAVGMIWVPSTVIRNRAATTHRGPHVPHRCDQGGSAQLGGTGIFNGGSQRQHGCDQKDHLPFNGPVSFIHTQASGKYHTRGTGKGRNGNGNQSQHGTENNRQHDDNGHFRFFKTRSLGRRLI